MQSKQQKTQTGFFAARDWLGLLAFLSAALAVTERVKADTTQAVYILGSAGAEASGGFPQLSDPDCRCGGRDDFDFLGTDSSAQKESKGDSGAGAGGQGTA